MQMTAIAWGTAWDRLDALVDAEGTAAHPYWLTLGDRGAAKRDLADALHALLAVHGAYPGLADEASSRAGDGVAAAWLEAAAHGMAVERDLIARLVVAAGPLPSTPGQAATDAALEAQRHAFRMLARSDRAGVAVGAAAALALDWLAVRRIFARAADAFEVKLMPYEFPDRRDTATMLNLAAESPAAERALTFGARALLDQHRALWSLLEARASARGR